jgi:hypothetical protein
VGQLRGARMAAAIPKPSAVVMAYTGHSEVAAHEPPTFVVVGEHDGMPKFFSVSFIGILLFGARLSRSWALVTSTTARENCRFRRYVASETQAHQAHHNRQDRQDDREAVRSRVLHWSGRCGNPLWPSHG